MDILERDRAGLPVSLEDPDYGVINEIIREAHRLSAELTMGYHTPEQVRAWFARLTGTPIDETLRLCPPFYAGFGRNIRVGRRVFINTGCTFMDRGGIEIGDDAFIGPNVSLITTNHAAEPAMRRCTVSRPIRLCGNVWIGAGAIVLPGVTVGENAIVGAGAVVTRDVPPNAVMGGNPARLIKFLGRDGEAER